MATVQSISTGLLNNRKFHIEYHGFLTNHAKHAVVALQRLDAGPDTIQKYWDECACA
jgi:hypothetical protein